MDQVPAELNLEIAVQPEKTKEAKERDEFVQARRFTFRMNDLCCSTSFLSVFFVLLVLAHLPSPALAHNPDTSYARIQIAKGHVEVRLTYDLFTLLKIAPLDSDEDRKVSRLELDRQLDAISAFLHQHVLFDINLQPVGLGQPVGFVWPPGGGAIPESDYHSAAGLIHFDFTQTVDDIPEDVTITFDFFDQFGHRHMILGVFEHEGEPFEVAFTRFEPDFVYDTGYRPSVRQRLVKFLRLGVEHIFLGYDHICFLIALIVVSRVRDLVFIVTSFTVAHSITLILAALEIVKLPTRLVEAGVAATIVYVAVENFWILRRVPSSPARSRSRWKLTFCFGLIHGFGFANVLRDLGLPSEGVVRCLISFNVGVELGQLAIVSAFWPTTFALSKWKHGERTKLGISIAILLVGLAWLADRALALGFMPI